MSCNIDISVNLNIHTAAAVRQVLYREQEGYTFDPKCVPPRVTDLREFILQLDEEIGKNLPEAHTHDESETSEESDS